MKHLDARDVLTNMTFPNHSLWNNPEGADLIIRCRPRGGREVYWKVHRDILVDMSEWMEKYMPPEAKDVSQWTVRI